MADDQAFAVPVSATDIETAAVAAKAAEKHAFPIGLIQLLPLVVAGALAAEHRFVPGWQIINVTTATYVVLGAGALYLLLLVVSLFVPKVTGWVRHNAPIVTLVVVTILAWDLLTAKSKILPAPFFPTIDKIVAAYVQDWQLLGVSVLYSVRLLAIGYLIGAGIGFISGVAIGWSPRVSYWLTPGLRFIGPIPATAWIPIAMVVFPTSFWASIFLLALSSWFSVTIMTSSGILGVSKSYYEVARTLGADEKYLIRHVAIPAAFPLVFVGLFMGLAMSFLTLIVAEMLGVKGGLGWYMTWSQSWAQFGKVYAALIIVAVLFSTLLWLMFKVRDRLLSWQKGLVRW